ncbi:MAG TPA: type II toxin-antitoxin system VapC family toxin [Verrucomicrobiae bacterium]
MKYLLDTNTLSELSKANPFPHLLEWLEQYEFESAISAISIGEMALGIERMQDSKRRRSLERTFGFLREDYAGKILDFTEGVAVEWARLVAAAQKQGRILTAIDSQIEATAVHFGLTVVTRNEKDFYHSVLNPWK